MTLSIASIVTIEAARLAMGASSVRQQVISHNIANASTPHHARMKVNFEDALTSAISAAKQAGSAEEVLAMMARVKPDVVADGSMARVQLDEEMAALSANSVQYHALAKGVSKYLSIASLIAAAQRG